MKNWFLILVLGACLAACQSNSSNNTSDEAADQSSTPTPAPAQVELLPMLDQEIGRQLVSSCDHIDYIYYELPLSMSMDEKPAIHNILSQIGSRPAPAKPSCKSIGRISFNGAGERITEAELYYDGQGCNYFVFLENGKPAYGNYLTDAGIQFYKNAFAQAQQQFGTQ
ncbi:MAG: hypothetical protein AAFV95_01075 [Bacteroidota bacterium]